MNDVEWLIWCVGQQSITLSVTFLCFPPLFSLFLSPTTYFICTHIRYTWSHCENAKFNINKINNESAIKKIALLVIMTKNFTYGVGNKQSEKRNERNWHFLATAFGFTLWFLPIHAHKYIIQSLVVVCLEETRANWTAIFSPAAILQNTI